MDTARYVEKIATLFGKIMTSVELGVEAESIGLTPSQVQGLSYLLHHGDSSIGDVAQGLGTSHPAAVKMIDRLEKKQLVSRSASAVDRRVSLVELTEHGKDLLSQISSKRTEVLTQALSKMQQTDLEGVMRGLETLLAAVLEESRTIESACLHCGDDHIGCCVVNRTHLELTGKIIKKR